MATCGHNGQAVGMAAAMCRENGWLPKQLAEPLYIGSLQQRLLHTGQYIPEFRRQESSDLAQQAVVSASSERRVSGLSFGLELRAMTDSVGLLLPISIGPVPQITFEVVAKPGVQLVAELRTASRRGNFTPDVLLETLVVEPEPAFVVELLPEGLRVDDGSPSLQNGHHLQSQEAKVLVHAAATHIKRSGGNQSESQIVALAERGGHEGSNGTSGAQRRISQRAVLQFQHEFSEDTYALVSLQADPDVEIRLSDETLPGLLTLYQRGHASVAKGASQEPPPGVGIDAFDFWTPERRPMGKNLAAAFDPPLTCYSAQQVANGICRPTSQVNAWVASRNDPHPAMTLSWPEPREIQTVEIVLDTDSDHPMETVLMQHPERLMPHCARNLRLKTADGHILATVKDNHQTRVVIKLNAPVLASQLILEVDHPNSSAAACVFEVKCYGPVTKRS
jgi:hypothetical protein